MEQFESLTLPQRVVLLGVADLSADEETPAKANHIIRRSRALAEMTDDVGTLTEAEVDSALNRLEAEGLVTVPEMDDTSPVGKGRPAYDLHNDLENVLAAADGDDRLGALVDAIDA
jgi:predicted ArsR family transcriptional regulator